jgi:hypothetical protein
MTTPGSNDVHGFTPNPRFVAPGLNDRDWADTPNRNWAPDIDAVIGGTPDPMRTGRLRTRDYQADPAHPESEFFLGVNGPGREKMQRHGVEMQDADGQFVEAPVKIEQAPNPRSIVQPEPRLTSRMSPHTYTFTRPFDQHIAREFNGVHFSMADHRREYPILGMAPVTRKRNTFRAEPAPWDQNLVDMPVDSGAYQPGPIQAVDVPATRNWRLT